MALAVEALEEKLGYRFRQRGLLTRALTHRSRSSEHTEGPESQDNEQLEFLGDSILGFVVSEFLVARNPDSSEGELSQLKAHLVSSTHLHRCALELDLGQSLLLGKGEERNGGRERKTLLADAVEAIIAAMHLDGGIDAARKFVHEHVVNVLEDPDEAEAIGLLNYKSVLQEKTQALGLPIPRYATVATSGPEHAKVFTVEVKIGEQTSRAHGSSKKAASQEAAHIMIQQLSREDAPVSA
jgi:ribonuclease-3